MNAYRLSSGEHRISHLEPHELPAEYADWVLVPEGLPVPKPTSEEVNTERDRRTALGFKFNGAVFDFDIRAKTNISGASQMAFMAVMAGVQEGNLRWHGGNEDFSWISQDNTAIPMDAQTVIKFGQKAANHETAHVLKARALKNMDPIPEDYAEDKWWPKDE
ncbi:DUF4376 domain-containing protein [Roseibium sediminis]|uniref:DUF4376 domain-containing protein n=1 Tax=Roseibium sediminis TaxID=1775174 RepID=UPI00123D594E|nr:DUF4376 domain-containing protein [Roseibium sediminis]